MHWDCPQESRVELCFEDLRRPRPNLPNHLRARMEEKNDDIEEKIDIINSVYLFLMDPEKLDGCQLRDFLTQIENAIEMRKRPGKLGEEDEEN